MSRNEWPLRAVKFCESYLGKERKWLMGGCTITDRLTEERSKVPNVSEMNGLLHGEKICASARRYSIVKLQCCMKKTKSQRTMKKKSQNKIPARDTGRLPRSLIFALHLSSAMMRDFVLSIMVSSNVSS